MTGLYHTSPQHKHRRRHSSKDNAPYNDAPRLPRRSNQELSELFDKLDAIEAERIGREKAAAEAARKLLDGESD
jgi:hypothetical protein